MALFRRTATDEDVATRLVELLGRKIRREPLWVRAMDWLGERLVAVIQEHVVPHVPRGSWACAGGGLGLVAVSSELHHLAPAAWPLAVVAGGGAALAAFWRSSGRWRWVVTGGGGAATVWLAVAWALGPITPMVVVALGGAAIGAILVMARGMRPRPQRSGREPDPAEIVTQWPEIAKAAKVPSAHAKLIARDATGFTILSYLEPGHVPAEAVSRLDQLESSLDSFGVRAGSLTISKDPEHASWCYVRVVVRDPLAKVLPWAGPTTDSVMGSALHLGRFADGKEVLLGLLPQTGEGVNLLVAGIKGSGKSGSLHVILGELAHSRDVVLWGIDLKRLEFPKWRACFDRLALELRDADQLLDAAWRVLHARSRELARLGLRAWEPSPAMPLLVLVVDELAELSESMGKLDRLARLGRALGIQLVLATQRPSAQALGDKGTELRSQIDAVVAMRVGRPEEGNVVLGQGRLSEGWRPDRLKAKGEFLILSPQDDHDRPRRARAFRVTDKDIERWARVCAELRPRLDDASARAAEGLS